MAHFARLDDNNFVVQVIVVHNNELLVDGVESEEKGIEFCQSLFPNTRWKQTSYNHSFRKNYAGVGYLYAADKDAFIPPKPYPSWTLNADTCRWEPPVPRPDTVGMYGWDETNQLWVQMYPQTQEPA